MDAWAMALGVRRDFDCGHPKESSSAFQLSSKERPLVPAEWSLKFWEKSDVAVWADRRVLPWDSEKAYHHMIVTDNDGRPVQRLIPTEDAAASIEHVCHTLPLEYFREHEKEFKKQGKTPKIAIYAHGGLNAEEDALERARIMAPYFEANDVYPLFIAWKTGFRETLSQILRDQWGGGEAEVAAGGVMDGLRGVIDWGREKYDDAKDRVIDWTNRTRERFSEAKDRSIELVCERVIKPVWTQMKQNAEASQKKNRGVRLLADHLCDLVEEVEELEIHVIGHSAGSLPLGYLFDLFEEPKVRVRSCTLFAPACSLRFRPRALCCSIEDRGAETRRPALRNPFGSHRVGGHRRPLRKIAVVPRQPRSGGLPQNAVARPGTGMEPGYESARWAVRRRWNRRRHGMERIREAQKSARSGRA